MRFENIPDPVSIPEAASKNYVENLFNDPSLIKDTAHDDSIDKNLDNMRFVNSLPAVREHLTPNLYVKNATDEPTLVQI